MFLRSLCTHITVILFARRFGELVHETRAQTRNTSNRDTTEVWPRATGNRQLYPQLIEQLLSTANPMVPPNADNVWHPVDIHITFSSNFVHQLEMNNQILAIYAGSLIQWYDRSLS